MDWLLLIACSLLISLGAIFMRIGNRRGTTSWGLSLYVGLVPCVVFGPFAWPHLALFPPWYAVLMIGTGAVAIVGIWALDKALRCGPVGPTFLIRSYSIIIPVLASALFYNEAMGPTRIVGLLVVAASVPLLQRAKRAAGIEPAAHRRIGIAWLLYGSLTFLAFGLADAVFRDAMARQVDYAPGIRGDYILGVVFLGYLGNMVAVPIGLLFSRTRPTPADAIWGTATGLVNGVAFILAMFVLGTMGGVLVFPTRTVISVAGVVFLAFVLFRERPGLKVAIGLVLGTIGVVLMAIKSG